MEKTIYIVSCDSAISASLSGYGYKCIPAAPSDFDDSGIGKDSIVIIDIASVSADEAEYAAELSRGRGASLCAISERFDGAAEAFLKKNGIPFYQTQESLAARPQSICAFSEKRKRAGTAVIADTHREHYAITSALFSLFGYDCAVVSDADSLIDQASDAAFVLHNLSMPEIDLLSFVKRTSLSRLFRNVPYIAYKEGSEGVTLREINSGIVRLTQYILTIDELWSVLAFNLFRKALYSGMNECAARINLSDNLFIAKDPIRTIFHSKDAHFFTAVSRMELERAAEAGNCITDVQQAMHAMHWISWMVRDRDDRISISAGV
ncbi:MAG: hypothetical protein ACRCUT_07685 [Spirochaetota bacterium]